MDLHDLVLEMKQLERRLMLYEEKYGILSQDFYDALNASKLSRYDEFDETRTDFSRWKGIYETWQRRKTAYSRATPTRRPSRRTACATRLLTAERQPRTRHWIREGNHRKERHDPSERKAQGSQSRNGVFHSKAGFVSGHAHFRGNPRTLEKPV